MIPQLSWREVVQQRQQQVSGDFHRLSNLTSRTLAINPGICRRKMETKKLIGWNMECPECYEIFNELERKPKALPCGHTFCLKCLETVDRCFIDKKDFMTIPDELPDNHNIMAMLRTRVTASANSVHVWCVDCNKPAEEKCICEKHKIASRKSFLFQQLLQKLKITENPLHPQNCKKFVESLTEVETEQAMQMMTGQMASTNILMRDSTTARWIAELSPKDNREDNQDAKLLQCILFLMRKKGIVSQEVLTPQDDRKPEEKPTVDPECVLDLNNLSSCKDQTKVSAEKEELFLGNQLLKTRRLLGLYCDRDKEWTLKLLQSLAPVLEEVHLYNFYFEHLQAVLDMPQLRWLVLEITSMSPKNIVELPPLKHESKVEFLWVNMPDRRHNNQIIKQIIKLYQASVQILYVSAPPYDVKTIEMFDDLELPNLQVLLYGNTYCGSDNCHDTMVGLRKRFPGKKIVCMSCERMDNFDD